FNNQKLLFSIIKDKDDHEGKSTTGSLIDVPVFVGNFSILTGFIIIDDEDVTRDVALGMPFLMPNDYEEVRSQGRVRVNDG
ncbi:hypothetical protein Tco_0447208, partial [Tanacetum coccineum]